MQPKFNIARFLIIAFIFGLCLIPAWGREIAVSFKVFPQDYELSGTKGLYKPERTKSEWRIYRLPAQRQQYIIRAKGYQPYFLSIDPQATTRVALKLEREGSRLRLIGEYPTGSQPKSVVFTPDGQHALVAQLNGLGLDLYETEPFRWVRQIDLPPLGKTNQRGYVEFALLPWLDEIWVSQMTTGRIHALKLSDFSYIGSFSSGGEWSKVITIHPDHQRAFVSNWLSEDVSVIDINQKKVTARIKCSGVPRGMAVSHDGQFLWVAIFGNGNIEKYRLSDLKRVKTFSWSGGAKRHLVLHPKAELLYASDMASGDIWAFDLTNEKLLKRVYIGPKLNTFDISPDGRYLFISSRGNNNPDGDYLIPGPDFGTMSVLDTASLTKIDWIWGRNQPTGLAVSPDGTKVAFTDFLDNNLELYDIRAFQ